MNIGEGVFGPLLGYSLFAKGDNMSVYLCVSESNYCHVVFDSMLAASFWCSKNPGYHVIIREVLMFQPKG